MSTDYSEPVAMKGAATAELPAQSAVIVRFVYRREEPEGAGRARMGPASVADRPYLAVTQVFHYDGFGNLIAVREAEDTEIEEDADDLDSWSCTPLERDADPDWFSQRARWYDPSPGRWMAEDPLRLAADDPNLYRYVSNRVTETPIPDAEAPQP